MKKKQEEKLWNIVHELESLQGDKQISENVRSAIAEALSSLQKTLPDSAHPDYNRKKLKSIWKEIHKSIDEMEKWCKKYEKFEKEPEKHKKYMEVDTYEEYKKILEFYNTDLLSLEQAIDDIYEGLTILKEISDATLGQIYYKIIVNNGKSRNDLLHKLKEEYSEDYVKRNIRSAVDNIIYGKVKTKNIKNKYDEHEFDVWENMLKYLPELCGENAKNPKDCFLEQYYRLIIDAVKSMDTYKNTESN